MCSLLWKSQDDRLGKYQRFEFSFQNLIENNAVETHVSLKLNNFGIIQHVERKRRVVEFVGDYNCKLRNYLRIQKNKNMFDFDIYFHFL